MNQKEWLEILTEVFTDESSKIDYLMLIITTISSIGVLGTGIFTFMAARSARDAVEVNIDNYNDDKRERELLLMPIFEIRNAEFSKNTKFDLVNVNIQHPVSITSFGLNIGTIDFKTEKVSNNVVKMKLEEYNLFEQQSLLISLYYTALNHRFYKTTLSVRRDNSTIFIDNITTGSIEI